jgi:hypothetical protein
MTALISRRRALPDACLAFAAIALSMPLAAQTSPFVGRWVASQPEHAVVIALTIGSSNTLIFPGLRQDGRSQALTLAIRNLQMTAEAATFTVDLPENEGALEFEFRLAGGDGLGRLRIVRVDGEDAADDIPSWALRKVP